MVYRRKDSYYRRAKAAGYRARSAYKLVELADSFKLLAPGDYVVDLGAWPGGWLQVALERVGAHGRVAAVDLTPVTITGHANVLAIEGDVRRPETLVRIHDWLGRPADVVLSDLAPKLTGISVTDAARAAELVEATLDALPSLLRSGGKFVVKLFMDAEHAALLARMQRMFGEVRSTRPEATRRGSAESYAVGIDFQAD
jgi:23S rRNA (uridine2552-2'-O)-methyltransferase